MCSSKPATSNHQGACRRHEPDRAVPSCWERLRESLTLWRNILLALGFCRESMIMYPKYQRRHRIDMHVTRKVCTQVSDRLPPWWPHCWDVHVGHKLQSTGHATSRRCSQIKLQATVSCGSALCNVQSAGYILPALTVYLGGVEQPKTGRSLHHI